MAAALAGQTVLAPNAELAALLFDALERAHRAAGREIWPTPQIRDFAGWQRDRYAQRQLRESALPRCLTEIEERELWRDIVATGDSHTESLDQATAARLARRARRTVIEYAIPWRSLAAQPSEDTEVFLRWIRQYDARCRALGCVSGDDLTGRIDPLGERLCWIESPAWRPVARSWLTRHGVCLAPVDAMPGAAPGAAAPAGTFRVHADSPGGELAAAAGWARSGLASQEDFRAWVCVPDLNSRRGDIVDAFDAALAVHRFALGADAGGAPYAVAGGTPLAEYASVRIALECLESAAAILPFARFSALLRSPYLQASDAEQSVAAMLDVTLRERAPSEAGMRVWLDLAETTAREHDLALPGAVQRLRAVAAELAAVRGARRFSEWLAVWTAALQRGPWASQARWSSVEYQAAERLRELLAALAASDAFFGSHSRDSAQRVLRRAARDTPFQPQTGVPPVWVSGQITDPWLAFDGLWVSNMSADRWPAPVEPVALLPVQVQRAYGVVSAGIDTQQARALDLQVRWLARARQCVFSHADTADGRVSAPSPLLPRTDPLYADGGAPGPRPHWQAQRRAAPPLERFLDELAPAFAPPERTRGVASLRAQSLCAFRGFAETRLGADGLEQPTPGFNERERGQIVHHALEHVWSVLRDSEALHTLSPPAQQDLLEEAARRALQAVCERRDPGPTWRRRELTRLRNVLGKWLHAERGRQPFAVESLEQDARTARFGGLEFRVRIDRSDRLLDGGRVLIDYKTGSVAADWRGDRPDNPQLPIYALLSPESLAAVAYGRVNAAESCFVFEAERPGIFRPGSRATALEGAGSLAALMQIWGARIENLAADLARGHAAVAPTATACRFCRLQGLCRVPSALDDEEPA